jgi:DNA-binding GntR family transcriptional regulator
MPPEDFSSILVPPPKRSLADDIVDRLREAIYTGQLAPNERLREERLAEFLQVSRGPIREALSQLEREGLVIKEPNRGATVARLSRDDLEEVYSLRLTLEQLAIRQAIRSAEPHYFTELQNVVNAMAAAMDRGITIQEATSLDIRFHEIIYQASKNRRLYNFWSILRPQVQIFLLARHVANPDFREHIIPGHQAILDAMCSKDEPRAVALLEEHLQAAYVRILKSYTRDDGDNPSSPIPGSR